MSIAEEIVQLVRLKENGSISEEEYQKAKDSLFKESLISKNQSTGERVIGVKDDVSIGTGSDYSPGRVFLSGFVAGIVLLLIGTLTAFFLGGGESIPGIQLLWFISPMGAAVAGGVAASKKGGTSKRVLFLAVLLFLFGLFISFLMDYFMMWMMTLAYLLAIPTTDPVDLIWYRHFISSFFAIMVGALIGMMFGKGVAPREEL